MKSGPRTATWFLNRFGSNTEIESAIGDLSEQYQRGRGWIWYWRQVLSIVYMGLFQEFRSDRRRFIWGLVKMWCAWGVIQFTAGMILMLRYVLLLRDEHQFRIGVSGFPFLRLQSGSESTYVTKWEFIVFTLALNVLTLLLVGRFCASSSTIQPRAMLLAFITTYVVFDAGWMVTNILTITQHQQIQVGLVVIRDLIALPLAVGTILIGGRRGLSSASQLKRG
jgi:hypothetical protein